MLKAVKRLLQRLRLRGEKKGQGLVEYAMVIAFVSLLIALSFGLAKGSLFAAISDAYSSCTSSLDALNRASFETAGGGGNGQGNGGGNGQGNGGGNGQGNGGGNGQGRGK